MLTPSIIVVIPVVKSYYTSSIRRLLSDIKGGWEALTTNVHSDHEHTESEYQKKLQKGDIEQLRRILGVLFD